MPKSQLSYWLASIVILNQAVISLDKERNGLDQRIMVPFQSSTKIYITGKVGLLEKCSLEKLFLMPVVEVNRE